MPSRANRTSDLAALTATNPVFDMDNVYLSDQGWAYRHYKREDKSLYWDEILVAGEVAASDTPDDFGAASPTFETTGGDGDQAPAPAATGSIFGTASFTTTTTFTETDGATVAATFSAPAGGGTTAVGTVVTSSGDMVGYSLSNAGDGYAVGETVTVTEDGGAGVATFEVTAVA